MAELLLTDAERAAELWTDLDDAALGSLLRKKLVVLRTAAEQMDRTIAIAAGLMLCCAAAEAGSDDITISLEGVTQAGRAFGDWKIVAVRMGDKM